MTEERSIYLDMEVPELRTHILDALDDGNVVLVSKIFGDINQTTTEVLHTESDGSYMVSIYNCIIRDYVQFNDARMKILDQVLKDNRYWNGIRNQSYKTKIRSLIYEVKEELDNDFTAQKYTLTPKFQYLCDMLNKELNKEKTWDWGESGETNRKIDKLRFESIHKQ